MCVLPQWENQFGSTEEDRLVTRSCLWWRRLIFWQSNTTSVLCRLDTSLTLFADAAACVLPQSTNWMWNACGPQWYEGQHAECGAVFWNAFLLCVCASACLLIEELLIPADQLKLKYKLIWVVFVYEILIQWSSKWKQFVVIFFFFLSYTSSNFVNKQHLMAVY